MEKRGSAYDFLFLNRGSVVAPYLDTIKKTCVNSKIILNTVDLHYLRERREAELNGSAEKYVSSLFTKAREFKAILTADVSIVLSEYEKTKLLQEVPDCDIRVLPLVFSDMDPNPPPYSERKDIVFIGSFPHMPNVDAVLFFAREVFPKLLARRPEILFHIVGSHPQEEILKLAELPGIVVHGYLKDLKPLFRSVRLSVAPLRYGAGIKGKIATTLAFGVPVVASPLAVEGTRLEHGKHVLVAETANEYIDQIIKIYDDENLWNLMSRQGQVFVAKNYSLTSNTFLLDELMEELDSERRAIDTIECYSKQEFDLIKDSFPGRFSFRTRIEQAMIPEKETGAFDIEGFCAVCGEKSLFRPSFMYASKNKLGGRNLIPNWREHLACEKCGFIMRLRAAIHLLYTQTHLNEKSSLYLSERVTPLYTHLQGRFPNLVGSEYLGDRVPLGAERDGIRNENLEQLTFKDDIFDCILSFDVLEHVTDEMVAFRECYRCLKRGGLLFFSVPFAYDRDEKVIRAKVLSNGSIEHLMEPEYHGNPLDHENTSLCFRYFAWDVLKDLQSIGFAETKVLHYWSRDYAYLGKFGFFILARK